MACQSLTLRGVPLLLHHMHFLNLHNHEIYFFHKIFLTLLFCMNYCCGMHFYSFNKKRAMHIYNQPQWLVVGLGWHCGSEHKRLLSKPLKSRAISPWFLLCPHSDSGDKLKMHFKETWYFSVTHFSDFINISLTVLYTVPSTLPGISIPSRSPS